MNEEQLTRLRSKLRRQKERIDATDTPFFVPRLRRFWQFLGQEPFLSPILAALQANKSGEEAANRLLELGKSAQTISKARELFDKLTTEEDHASLIFRLIEELYAETSATLPGLTTYFRTTTPNAARI
jgi:hypothetical protein